MQLHETKKDIDGEKSTLIYGNNDLEPATLDRLNKMAVITSWFSVVFSLGTGIAACVLGVTGKSESLFAYGLDAVLDCLTSLAVAWRFLGPQDADDVARKERTACIVIGGLFIVSASSLVTKATISIVTETHEDETQAEIILYEAFALSCGIISLLIAGAKIYLGWRLRSRAMATDSIITLVGAVACFCGVAGLQLYVDDTDLWFMDDVFGMCLGAFLLGFGIRTLYKSCKEEKESWGNNYYEVK